MAGGKVDMAEINMIAKRDNLSKEEIEQLKKEWLSEIEAEAKQNDKEMEEMKQSYEEKLKAAQAASNAGTLMNILYRLFFLRLIAQFFTQIYMNCFVNS